MRTIEDLLKWFVNSGGGQLRVDVTMTTIGLYIGRATPLGIQSNTRRVDKFEAESVVTPGLLTHVIDNMIHGMDLQQDYVTVIKSEPISHLPKELPNADCQQADEVYTVEDYNPDQDR